MLPAQQDIRMTMKTGPLAKADMRGRSKTMSDYAYACLRADIIAGRLEPGSKLRVDELRGAYDIGATPLREALSRLSADGFVISEGQRGFRVVPISTANLEDLTQVRILIETETLKNSIGNGDDEWEAHVVAAYYRLSKAEERHESRYGEWEQLNDAFHSALLAACASEMLLNLHRTLYDQHKRYRNISRLAQVVPRDVHGEHREIYEAVLERNFARACAATEQHIRRTMEVTLAVIRKAEADAQIGG
jgi:GntR family carbon starvation induced transcriptional regulator